VLTGRLGNSYDIASNGFLIDGFPRTASQARGRGRGRVRVRGRIRVRGRVRDRLT